MGITGLGVSFPSQKISNEFLENKLKVNSGWIQKRTGIKSRFYVSQDETAADLSVGSAKSALRQAGVKASDLGLIVCGTTSGNYLFPATACKVQDALGAAKALAFDISASATSFQTGLSIAFDHLKTHPPVLHALVIGTAVQSPYIDFGQPEIAVLLGDASGAAVVSRVKEGSGILSSKFLCRGNLYEAARLRGGGSQYPLRTENVRNKFQYIELDGVAMGREFLKTQPELMRTALREAKLDFKDVSVFIFHQANLRLIELLMQKLACPLSSTATTIQKLGNCAEASVPATLADASKRGLIHPGALIMLSSVGAGCTLAVTLLRGSQLGFPRLTGG